MAGVKRTGEEPWEGWDVASRDLSMVAGVVCVGMGDAAASLIGRRFGRRKWYWAGGKSLEGSAAFAIAVTIGLVAGKTWLSFGGWNRQLDKGIVDSLHSDDWPPLSSPLSLENIRSALIILFKAGLCAMGASLNEAVLTGGNDNVVVPVVLWLLVRGVGL